MEKVSIVKYEHHGVNVSVREDLKGKHRDFCLCYLCARFKPGTDEHCEVAKAVYENCVKLGVVTPMWECPKFSEKEAGCSSIESI